MRNEHNIARSLFFVLFSPRQLSQLIDITRADIDTGTGTGMDMGTDTDMDTDIHTEKTQTQE